MTDMVWHKAASSNGGAVEVAALPDGGVAMRKESLPGSHEVVFSKQHWQELADQARTRTGSAQAGPGTEVRIEQGPRLLVFTRDEWVAFIGGVNNGEFDGFGEFDQDADGPAAASLYGQADVSEVPEQ